MNCRFCDSADLDLFLDLGFSPLGNSFLTEQQMQEPEIHYPLQAYLCNSCKLSQLGYVPPPQTVYNPEYAYEAGITTLRKDHHKSMASSVSERFELEDNSLVIDIGSNVGILLSAFKERGMNVVGIDASDNVAQIARDNGIPTITGFFGEKISQELSTKFNTKAKVVTATNVFAHINDYTDFMNGVKNILSDDGVFIFQVHYFIDLVDKMQYDMIFHEHILFESIKPLVTFFKKHGMELFDVERFDIDGGVIRCYVSKPGKQKISSNVDALLELENEKKIHSKEGLLQFANKVKQHREDLISTLNELKKQKKRIVAVSMPAKGVALLNYSKIDSRLIEYATERSSLKIGKFAPGNHIPIKSDEQLLLDSPDYAVLLAWNFADEIIANNKQFLENGGKFIVPIPTPKIVGLEDIRD